MANIRVLSYFWSCIIHILISMQLCYVTMSNQFTDSLMLTHLCPNWKTTRLQVEVRFRSEGERWNVGLSDPEWMAEGIWSSDVLCLDLQTAPDWGSIPTDPGHTLKPGWDDTEGKTQCSAWGRERFVIRPHANNYSCCFFFLLQRLVCWLIKDSYFCSIKEQQLSYP